MDPNVFSLGAGTGTPLNILPQNIAAAHIPFRADREILVIGVTIAPVRVVVRGNPSLAGSVLPIGTVIGLSYPSSAREWNFYDAGGTALVEIFET